MDSDLIIIASNRSNQRILFHFIWWKLKYNHPKRADGCLRHGEKDSKEKRVKVRYYETDFIGHTTAKELQYSFNKKLKSFIAFKLLRIGLDGPSVNWSFYGKLCDETSKLTFPDLVQTGSCDWCEYLWKLGKTLKALFDFFSYSPAWRFDYTDLTGMSYPARNLRRQSTLAS